MSTPRQDNTLTDDELRKAFVTFLVGTYVLHRYNDSEDVYAAYQALDEKGTKKIVDGMKDVIEDIKKKRMEENKKEYEEEKQLRQFIDNIWKKTAEIEKKIEHLRGEKAQDKLRGKQLQDKLSQLYNEYYLNSGFTLLAANCYLGYMLANIGTPGFKQNDMLLDQFIEFLNRASEVKAELIKLTGSEEKAVTGEFEARGQSIFLTQQAEADVIKMLAFDFREKGDFAFSLMQNLCAIYFNLKKRKNSSLHQEFFEKIKVFNELFNRHMLFTHNEQLLDALLVMHMIPLKERTDLLEKLNIPQDQITMFKKYSAKPRPKPSQIGTFAQQGTTNNYATNDDVMTESTKPKQKKK